MALPAARAALSGAIGAPACRAACWGMQRTALHTSPPAAEDAASNNLSEQPSQTERGQEYAERRGRRRRRQDDATTGSGSDSAHEDAELAGISLRYNLRFKTDEERIWNLGHVTWLRKKAAEAHALALARQRLDAADAAAAAGGRLPALGERMATRLQQMEAAVAASQRQRP